MFFGIFTSIYFILALVLVYLGIRLLGKFKWIFQWLRGTLGILLVGVSLFFIFLGFDFFSYHQLLEEKPVTTMSFTKVDDQHYKVVVTYLEDNSREDVFDIHGDLWQMDARVIRWKGFVSAMGASPAYRLDRLSGRYFSLEDERRETRSVHQLTNSEYGLDVWQLLKSNLSFIPWVEASYGSATYLPMKDGAIFQVTLSRNGLAALPLNDIAKEAVNRW